MTTPIAAVSSDSGGLGTYEQHIPDIQALLSTLPACRPYSTFKGGAVLRVGDGHKHFVAVLLPPTGVAEENLLKYLADHFDGDWEVPSTERYGQVEAWHLMPPWMDNPKL